MPEVNNSNFWFTLFDLASPLCSDEIWFVRKTSERQKTRSQTENTQTTHRKTPVFWELNLQPSCCEVMSLQTAAPLHSSSEKNRQKEISCTNNSTTQNESIRCQAVACPSTFFPKQQLGGCSEVSPTCRSLAEWARGCCIHEGTSKSGVNYISDKEHNLFGLYYLVIIIYKTKWWFVMQETWRRSGSVGLSPCESTDLPGV